MLSHNIKYNTQKQIQLNMIEYGSYFLVLSRLELIFLMVATRGLCFGYVLKRVMLFKVAQYF